MALTEDQLALITRLDSGKGTVGGAIAVCQFEGLGLPSKEDVEAALQELRK